jgi:hypothetical protein
MPYAIWHIKGKRDACCASLFFYLELNDTPAAIRTRDLQLRRLTLYPAELRVRAEFKIHQCRMRVNHTRLLASREENTVKEEQDHRAENGHQVSGLVLLTFSKQIATEECPQEKADDA